MKTQPEEMLQHLPVSILEGTIILDKHAGNGRRILVVETTEMILEAKSQPGVSLWFSIKKARNLIGPGVGVRVQTVEIEQCLYMQSLTITAVQPRPPYLARLFSFGLRDLNRLFATTDQSDKHQLPDALITACEPASREQLQSVYEYCQTERLYNRSATLWKTPALQQLSQLISDHQLQHATCTILSKPQHQRRPRVSRGSLKSLARIKNRFLRDCDGAMDNQCVYCPESQRYHYQSSVLLFGSTPKFNHGADPAHNLPDTNDQRRQTYIDQRKRPQIHCLLELLRRHFFRHHTKTIKEKPPFHVVDVGGGRGYLGLALAAELKTIDVTILDNNKSSLQAGRAIAEQFHLSNIDFVQGDLSDLSSVQRQLIGKKQNRSIDLVVGLHCCGGLSEAALTLAINNQADFCVSTCCFRSLSNLATLTRFSKTLVVSNNDSNDSMDEYTSDLARVATLAVTVGSTHQQEAIRAYNSMRLQAAEALYKQLWPDESNHLQTWQETFPIDFSVQNRVLLGRKVIR